MVTRPSEACVRATRHALKIITHDGVAVLGLVENMLGFNCDSCHSVRPLFPQSDFRAWRNHPKRRFSGGFRSIRGCGLCRARRAVGREYPDAPLTKQSAAIAANLEQQIARRAAPAPVTEASHLAPLAPEFVNSSAELPPVILSERCASRRIRKYSGSSTPAAAASAQMTENWLEPRKLTKPH